MESIPIDTPRLISAGAGHYGKQMVFSGENCSVFWVSGKPESQLKINLFCYNNRNGLQQFPINKESALHEYFAVGNDHLKAMNVPMAYPQMIITQNKRQLIVFSYFKFGSKPAVYFYDVESQKEVLKIFGASMLVLHTKQLPTLITKGRDKLVFYADFCQNVIEDEN